MAWRSIFLHHPFLRSLLNPSEEREQSVPDNTLYFTEEELAAYYANGVEVTVEADNFQVAPGG